MFSRLCFQMVRMRTTNDDVLDITATTPASVDQSGAATGNTE
jgi:hypothetical protein